jgi:hypothetical protein
MTWGEFRHPTSEKNDLGMSLDTQHQRKMTWGKKEDAQLKKNDPTMINFNQLLN